MLVFHKNCYLVLAGGPPRVVGPGAPHHLHHLYGRHWHGRLPQATTRRQTSCEVQVQQIKASFRLTVSTPTIVCICGDQQTMTRPRLAAVQSAAAVFLSRDAHATLFIARSVLQLGAEAWCHAELYARTVYIRIPQPSRQGSVLFFSRPRSEGWPHHGRTFSIYLCPLTS